MHYEGRQKHLESICIIWIAVKTKCADGEMVLRTAREYAETVQNRTVGIDVFRRLRKWKISCFKWEKENMEARIIGQFCGSDIVFKRGEQ